MLVTYQILVSGLVQGVGFRFFTFKQANKLSIKGKVENLENGDVLVIAQGEDPNVQQLIQWLKKGSPGSVVDNIKILALNTDEIFQQFSCY